ncbi:MAG: hypothetical protein MR971_02355 [Bacteroidales bacterium]|nr:hypothetical protein [Bacteroidales bacterium]
MKKITCLLALFLLFLGGTAVAQVITSVGSPVAPSAIKEGKTYVLYAQEKGYVNVNGDNYNVADRTSPTAYVGAEANPYIYTFEGNSTDGWKIKNSNRNYLPGFIKGASGRFANGSNAGVFTIAAVADGTNTDNTLSGGSNMVTICNSATNGLNLVWNSDNGCLGVNAYNGGTAEAYGTTALAFQICEVTTTAYTGPAITKVIPRITNIADLKEGYSYLIRNVGNSDRRGYVFEESNSLKVTLGDAFYNATPADKFSDACIFTVTGNGTDGFTIVGKSGTTYYANSTLQTKSGRDAGIWNVKTPESYLNLNPGNVVQWNQANDANGVWEFYPVNVDAANLATITYNIKQDGTTIATTAVEDVPVGFSFPVAPSQTSAAYYSLVGYPTGTVTETSSYDLTYTENLPFQTSPSFAEANWYYLTINADKYVLTNNGSAASIDLSSTKLNVNDYNANLWCFVGNAFTGFKIYNKAAGENKVLSSSTNTSDGNTGGNTYPVLTATSDLSGKNETWAVTTGNTMNEVTGFYLSQQGYPMNRMNRRGSTLAYWNTGADNGSTFLVTAESADAARATMGTPYCSVGVNVGQVSQETADTYTQEACNALTTGQAVADFFAGLYAAYIMPEAGKYYRIINEVRQSNSKLDMVSVHSDATHTQGQASSKGNVDMLWQFEVCENGYKIKRANADQYMGPLAQNGNQELKNYTEGAKFTIELLTEGYVRLLDGNGKVMHDDGSHKLCAWDSGKGSASSWQIAPATELEVALHTVDETSYASAYLPFPVQGEGIYTGSINGDGSSLNMTAQTGVVPAETGIVIKSPNTTATLTIGGTPTTISENSLTGSLTALTGNLTNYLVLGVSNDNTGIGFFTPSENLHTIAANKAYLLASEVPDAPHALAMNFGGEATGVGTVITENGIQSNAPVFDLSGRRVMQTVKGGLYIQNGKKFIVK